MFLLRTVDIVCPKFGSSPMFANSSKTKCTWVGRLPPWRSSAVLQRTSTVCHMSSVNRKLKVGLVSLMDAKTHVFCPASPIDPRLISSRLSSADTSLTDSGFSRTLHEMMMLLRVLPAAVLKAL